MRFPQSRARQEAVSSDRFLTGAALGAAQVPHSTQARIVDLRDDEGFHVKLE